MITCLSIPHHTFLYIYSISVDRNFNVWDKMTLDDYQFQLYVFAGISFSVIILLLILIVILFIQVSRLAKEVKKSKSGQFQFQSPEIHPNEELAKRGFRQFPSINSR